MTQLEHAILTFVHQNQTPHWSDLMNHFPVSQILDVQSVAKKLLNVDHFLEKTFVADAPPNCRVRLSSSGLCALNKKNEQLEAETRRMAYYEEQLQSLRAMAAAAQRHADEAREQSVVARQQADAAQRQADAAVEQVRLAREEAARAERQAIEAGKDAEFARKQSRRSNRIAACAVWLSLVTWLFTGDDVLAFISSVVRWLQTIL